MTNLFPTNEIVTSLVADASKSDFDALVKNPKDFMLANYNIELNADIDFKVVENTANDVVLALPYYSAVAEVSAVKLSKEQLGSVAGGEIAASIILALSVVGATVAGAIGVSAIGGTAAAILGGGVIAAGVAVGAATTVAASTAVGIGANEARKATGNK